MSALLLFNPVLRGATMSHASDVLTTGDLEAIMRQHRIPAREWVQWSALVYEGRRPTAALLARLRRGNRGAASSTS